MAIPRQTAVWDERRNTSGVRLPPPDALPNALRAMERWRRENPEHARWIADGAPPMTSAEHVARFGVEYDRRRR